MVGPTCVPQKLLDNWITMDNEVCLFIIQGQILYFQLLTRILDNLKFNLIIQSDFILNTQLNDPETLSSLYYIGGVNSFFIFQIFIKLRYPIIQTYLNHLISNRISLDNNNRNFIIHRYPII